MGFVAKLRTFLAILALAAPASAGTPPAGFVESVLLPSGGASGVASPTACAYEPGTGHLWVVEQGGRIVRREAPGGAVTTARTLACVDSNGERGGLGIAFSPDFLDGAAARHVFVYYTRSVTSGGGCAIAGAPTGSRNQVSRFLENGGLLTNEQVILAGPVLQAQTNHNAGAIRFAADGTLFVAMGDNDTDHLQPPLSRDMNDLRGKLLRIAADGSIPGDNPFVGVSGVREEIWAFGLRNPFRFSIDPETDALFIADVGEGTWEAVYIGEAGADYGYPCFEGGHPFRSCNPAPPAGSVTAPVLTYGHGSQTPPVSGNSITGGPVYRATLFPPAYRGNYFFGDFVDDWIRHATVTSGPGLGSITTFMSDATDVVDMAVSPAGCLTWVSYSEGVRNVCFGATDADLDGDGFTPDQGDCDDGSPEVYPGAPEICDERDNDCDGSEDEGLCSDFDVDGDLHIDGVELSWIGRAFSECSADPDAEWWSGADYDEDGCVDGSDLAILGATFGCEGNGPLCD